MLCYLVQADELADRDFTKISDGQRQRVLLARAVCQQPEIILLDEPTSFLDIKGKIELLTILRQLAQENRWPSLSACTSWSWRKKLRTQLCAYRRRAFPA